MVFDVAEDKMQARMCIKSRFLTILIGFLSVSFALFVLFTLIWLDDTTIAANDVNSPELDYAVVVDAGSSGSRLFIYVWPPHVGNIKQLLQIKPLLDERGDPVVMKKSPGLSSVALNPETASDYIFPMLEFASNYIPQSKHKETQLFILATAGLRLLDKEIQENILDDLRGDIPKRFGFLISTKSVEVISGELEGVYQWIATNYVLGRFDHHHEDIDDAVVAVDLADGRSEQSIVVRKQTVGIMDMGGASLQLAVEVTNKFDLDDVKASVVDINLSCETHDVDHLYKIFVTTFLGMGANEARSMYEKLLVTDAIAANSSNKTSSLAETIWDPCLAKDFVTRINVTLDNASPNPSTVNLRGSGNFDVCKTRLTQQARNMTGCRGRPCTANRLPFNAGNALFYGFSEFWYSMEDVFRQGGKYTFKDFKDTVSRFCKTPWQSTYRKYNDKLYPLADWQRLTLECFKAAWMTAVIHDGLGFGVSYDGLRSTPNSVHEKVFHWTLGALVYRTRFFPLKEIQKSVNQSGIRQWDQWPVHLTHHMLLLCILLVVAAILVYLQRLRCLSRLCCTPKSNHAYYGPTLLQDRMERGFSKDVTYFKLSQKPA